MSKLLLMISTFIFISLVSYISFIFGEKNLIHASIEDSRAVLREYRALNYTLIDQNDIRFLSTVDMTDKPVFKKYDDIQNHRIVAAIKPVQSKNIYLILYSNGLIKEINGF